MRYYLVSFFFVLGLHVMDWENHCVGNSMGYTGYAKFHCLIPVPILDAAILSYDSAVSLFQVVQMNGINCVLFEKATTM